MFQNMFILSVCLSSIITVQFCNFKDEKQIQKIINNSNNIQRSKKHSERRKEKKSYVFGNFDSKRKYQRRQKQIIQILKQKIIVRLHKTIITKHQNYEFPLVTSYGKWQLKRLINIVENKKEHFQNIKTSANKNCAQKKKLWSNKYKKLGKQDRGKSY